GVAASTWNITVAHLSGAGLVSKIDGQALRLLCEAVALYQEASDDIAENGLVFETVSREGAVRKHRNPAVTIRNEASREILAILKQFGLTPASRNGIHRSESSKGDEEQQRIEAILGISSPN